MDTVWIWFVDSITLLFNNLINMNIISSLSIGALILINIILIIILNTFRRLTHGK